MPRGGARPGAGRKKGSVLATKSRAVAEAISLTGETPLEVMLQAMRHYQAAGEIDKASNIAKDAAPYIHPRLAAIEHSGGLTVENRISSEPMAESEWEGRHTAPDARPH